MGANRSDITDPWLIESAQVSPSYVATAVASFDTFTDLLAVASPADGVIAQTAGASAVNDGLGATYRYIEQYPSTPAFPQSGRPTGDTTGAWVQVARTTNAVANNAALDALAAVTGAAWTSAGYTTTSDGGGGVWAMVAGSTATADGGTVRTVSGGRAFRVNDGILSAKWYGATGDGSTDDTATLNAALAACASSSSREILIPPGTYKITSTLAVPAGVTIRGYGATITTANQITAVTLGSGCSIFGLTVQGPASGTYNSSGIGIRCSGTSNGTGNAPTRVAAPNLRDCTIKNFGLYGVLLEYVTGGLITGCTLSGHGRTGIGGVSCNDTVVTGNVISTIGPGDGSGGDAYGIFIDRNDGVGAVAQVIISDPPSNGCTVSHNRISGVIAVGGGSNGQGINTHAGVNFSIVGNRISGCQLGIAVTASGVSGAYELSAHCVSVVGNAVYGTAGIYGYGIVVSGAISSNASAYDKYTEGVTVQGNTILNHGATNDSLTGAILLQGTRGSSVVGNAIRQPRSVGININLENRGFVVQGNTITDPHDNTLTAPVCVRVSGNNCSGQFAGNTFVYENGALDTYVSVEAIRVAVGLTGLDLNFGQHTFVGIAAGHLVYQELTSTGVTASGIYEERGTVGVSLVSGHTPDQDYADVAFAKRFPQAPTSITLSQSGSTVLAGGKVPTWTVTNVTTTGFRVVTSSADRTNWSASNTLSLFWRATT